MECDGMDGCGSENKNCAVSHDIPDVAEKKFTIEALKVLFPKKALMNGKSTEYKRRFSMIFEGAFMPSP